MWYREAIQSAAEGAYRATRSFGFEGGPDPENRLRIALRKAYWVAYDAKDNRDWYAVLYALRHACVTAVRPESKP